MTLTTTTSGPSDTASQLPPTAPATVKQDTPPPAGRAARRTFTNEFKRAVVQEYDAGLQGISSALSR